MLNTAMPLPVFDATVQRQVYIQVERVFHQRCACHVVFVLGLVPHSILQGLGLLATQLGLRIDALTQALQSERVARAEATFRFEEQVREARGARAEAYVPKYR